MTTVLPAGYEAVLKLDHVDVRHDGILVFAATDISMRRPSVWTLDTMTEEQEHVVTTFIKAVYGKVLHL